MTALLEWIGARARWVLALGCIAALFLEPLSAALRPVLPALVSLVLGLAMARVDLRQVMRNLGHRKAVRGWLLATMAMMPLTGWLGWSLATGLGLGPEHGFLFILYAAAPPIASSAGLCFLLGYNARLAVEVTVTATVLTPILGPMMLETVAPGASGLNPLDLAARLGLMILGGVALALALRRVLTPERIARRGRAFDGVAACVMVLFVIPLFDGVGRTILAEPGLALTVLVAVVALNLGSTIAMRALLARGLQAGDAGALGLMWGNRTVALYLAALPPDPLLSLFVALYQFPMYFTPAVLMWLGLQADQAGRTARGG
ncbi:MAG: hypothetical protein AAGK98_10740 [Pseudomonadota bacterium]